MNGRIIGVCGNIGSGKSTYARAQKNVNYIDCDSLAKELLSKNIRCRMEFGEFFDSYGIKMFVDGKYNKEEITNLLFKESAHPTAPIFYFNLKFRPYLLDAIQKRIDLHSDIVTIIESATLLSSELRFICDSVVEVVNMDVSVNIWKGVSERSNMSSDDFFSILNYQKRLKKATADHMVIFTGRYESSLDLYRTHFEETVLKGITYGY